ncbi:MAG TPA: nucleotidyltransferase domain-containing protein [Chloroflexota bacterium]|nr:nucleotidyltransferase domain-containing protein [Chloroflexota bacterium]
MDVRAPATVRPVTSTVDWDGLIQRFDRPEAHALVLMGSHARGDPNPFSDIDLVRFTTASAPSLPGSGSHLVAGHLVVVSDCPPSDVEKWFAQPELALGHIPGLRSGHPLRDDGTFAALRERAEAFVWDDAMQARADAFASDSMVGWVEEVHKGLAGLWTGDTNNTGRLLDAEFGLSWGLNRLVEVQRGVPLVPLPNGAGWSTDWFTRAEQVVGPSTEWVRLRRLVFGIPSLGNADDLDAAALAGTSAGTGAAVGHMLPLRERVRAGLRFYVATAELLADIWRPPAADLIDHTVHLVRETLSGNP